MRFFFALITLLLAMAGPAMAVPPIDAALRERIAAGAVDGRDGLDDGYLALAAYVASWPPPRAEAVAAAPPDPDRLLADPSAHRGEWYRFAGRLEQARALPRPFDTSQEWFVRLRDGRAVVVFIPDAGVLPAAGVTVVLDGVFYKRLDADARDGSRRQYAAFVGRLHVPPEHGVPPIVLAIVIGLAVAFFFLAIIVRRGGRERHRARAEVEPSRRDDLPEDSASALTTLRQEAAGEEPNEPGR